MYMYVYICIYIHMHIYIYTYIYMHMHIYKQRDKHINRRHKISLDLRCSQAWWLVATRPTLGWRRFSASTRRWSMENPSFKGDFSNIKSSNDKTFPIPEGRLINRLKQGCKEYIMKIFHGTVPKNFYMMIGGSL